MFILEPNYNFIFYIQAIIWFILTGYLINLIIKNKLTYIDEFRQKFVSGIFLLIITITIFLIFQITIQIPQEIYIILYTFIVLPIIGFIILTLLGISHLINHVSSIIDFETKNKKKYAILISIVISIICSILYAIPKLHDVTQIPFIILYLIATICFFYASTYTFLLHQEMKKIDLNFLLYIALSFLTISILTISLIFVDVTSDVFYWVIVFFCFMAINIFLIVGYLDFKNKINKGLAK